MIELMALTGLLAALLGLLGFYVHRSVTKNAGKKPDAGGDRRRHDRRRRPSAVEKEGDGGDPSAKQRQAGKKKPGQQHHSEKAAGKDKFAHPWLMSTLKGHSAQVVDLDVSENGKYAASCSTDGAVLIWLVKEFDKREHKAHRGNIAYDTATKLCWSPDSKAFVVNKAKDNVLEVYKVPKKEDGHSLGQIQPAIDFPCIHSDDTVGIGISSTGRFIMSCSAKTDLAVWSLKGEVLARLDTCSMKTYCAKISPCGRYIATSGFTPEVKVYEVKFTRTGEFTSAQRAFELSGHTSGVYSFDFNADSSRMASLSKDGTWRVFDTKIEYIKGQDASCLLKVPFPDADPSSLITLSSDGQIVCIAHRNTLHFFSADDGSAVGVINQPHAHAITSVRFDRENRWLLTSGDKHIRVFHNVPGYKERLRTLTKELARSTTEGMKERVHLQIKDIKNVLSAIEK